MSKPITLFLAIACFAGAAIAGNPEAESMRATSINILTGRCHCGYITYEADGAQAKSVDCVCRGCQRASGLLRTQYLVIPSDALKITAGKPTDFRAKDGVECAEWGFWQFCSKCGTHLFWVSNKGDVIDIFAGTLDDTSAYKPETVTE